MSCHAAVALQSLPSIVLQHAANLFISSHQATRSTCWLVPVLQAKGPTAYPNNAAFVQEFVCSLLASSFPNMTPVQIQSAVAGMTAIEDKRAFKHHMRDFLVQVWCALLSCCRAEPASDASDAFLFMQH